MTVKELIELLEKEDPEASVYYNYDGELAIKVIAVNRNALEGNEKTVLIV